LEKYHLHYSYLDNLVKFSDKRLYSAFNCLLLKNTFHLLKYLSANSNPHIAQHYLTQDWNQYLKNFDAEVEKGDQVYYPYVTNSLEEKTIKWIWFLGAKYVFQWIVEFAQGITELEKMGIYHADLAVRNTIRVARG
jgi:hypothetical protein